MSQLPERNDPCPCGSGRKYKNCCRRTGPGWTEEPKPRNAFRSGFAGSEVAHARSVPERNEAFLIA
ncbi:SEC-C metal-binding domain-containing protein, partial [Acinetobacter baumannii]